MTSRAISRELAEISETIRCALPERYGGYWYLERSTGSKNGLFRTPVLPTDGWSIPCDLSGRFSSKSLLLDTQSPEAGIAYPRVGFQTTDDGSKFVLAVDPDGRELYSLYVYEFLRGDLDGGAREIVAEFHGVGRDFALSPDGSYFYYAAIDYGRKQSRLVRRDLTDTSVRDETIFDLSSTGETLGLRVLRDRRYACVDVRGPMGCHRHILDLQNSDPFGSATDVLRNGSPSSGYIEILDSQGMLLGSSDAGGSIKLEYAYRKDSGERVTLWQDSRNSQLVDFELFVEGLVAIYRCSDEWFRHVSVLRFEGADSAWHEISFEEHLRSPWESENVAFGNNPDWNSSVARLRASTLVDPERHYEVDLSTGSVSTVDWNRRACERISKRASARIVRESVTAADGCRLPITIVEPLNRFDEQERAPILLHVYGSYGVSASTSFLSYAPVLTKRGVSIAVAHVRGGGEFGRCWHMAGVGAKKIQTIGDFLRIADYLVQVRQPKSAALVAIGASAGSLVVGAGLNMRPDLFAGAIVVAPFVDLVAALGDDDSPLLAADRAEYGDPSGDPEIASIVRSYSPLQNVSVQDYPPVLVVLNENDARSDAKSVLDWVSRLQRMGTGVDVVTRSGSGHSGPSADRGTAGMELQIRWMLRALRGRSREHGRS